MPNKPTSIEGFEFGDRKVFIFSDHAVALKAWAHVRQSLPRSPMLLTLDYHTDTREPFVTFGCVEDRGNVGYGWRKYAENCIAQINIRDPATIDAALQNLKNDEHIRTAIQLGLIDSAFVLAYTDESYGPTKPNEFSHFTASDAVRLVASLNGSDQADVVVPQRPHTYAVPPDRIFYLPNGCEFPRDYAAGSDEFKRAHANEAIESFFLDDKLSYCNEMIRTLGFNSIFDAPYILDIDLDYFMTKAAFAPNDPSTFHSLLKQAQAVTIALEPRFIESQRIDPDLDVNFSRTEVMSHIETALGQRTRMFEL